MLKLSLYPSLLYQGVIGTIQKTTTTNNTIRSTSRTKKLKNTPTKFISRLNAHKFLLVCLLKCCTHSFRKMQFFDIKKSFTSNFYHIFHLLLYITKQLQLYSKFVPNTHYLFQNLDQTVANQCDKICGLEVEPVHQQQCHQLHIYILVKLIIAAQLQNSNFLNLNFCSQIKTSIQLLTYSQDFHSIRTF
eukprot:TRINITY_DN1027_c0_g1_i13.p3 TRINITY_DN1027_c0_g1~~TRINITY_DN1027_c0_g1_i13.p3  ORF type:complete len:189 (-),score=-11.69 TRINITY_DN1027_c0_g1_i13:88-654(-)